MLGTIVVTGAQAGTKASMYQQAAPTAVVTSQEIERYRGLNAADMFWGTAGVMSEDSRNSGSGRDMNICGMQGMERGKVTIDGAMNTTTIWQGYQGISDRSYVDPDFIAGIEVTKGVDASSRGIAGTVAMRTLKASDIVKPGSNGGARIKAETGGNISTPVAGTRSGYFIDNNSTHTVTPIELSPASAIYLINRFGGDASCRRY